MTKRFSVVVFLVLTVFITFCVAVPRNAFAAAVISSGPISLGVNDEGHISYNSVGLALAGVGDAIIPGCW